MAPSILEMAEEDTPILGIKSTLTISLPFPEVRKPTVTTVKIVPALSMNEVIPPSSVVHITITVKESPQTGPLTIPPESIIKAPVTKG
uniref:Uncharacterized protein n=1 Tax=Arundo donax TaxID=35708 RepID=A0A0A9ESV4_ARUDO